MANADINNRTYARLDEVKGGDTIELDGDFDCAAAGPAIVCEDDHGLYFECTCGEHYLDGQDDGDGYLVGVYLTR